MTAVRYCARCATPLPGSPPTCCSACGYELFLNPRPTGSIVVIRDESFLAVRRARDPRQGWWDLPGGFCDGWELPASAAVREAREELGVTVRLDRLIGMYLGSYEFQAETLPVLDSFFVATIVDGDIVLDPSEASEYTWLPLADPPEMAFPSMNQALGDLLAQLWRGAGSSAPATR